MGVREWRERFTLCLWRKTVLVGLGSILVFLNGNIAASEAGGGDGVIASRAASRPVVDGDFSDACWADAVLVEDFTLPDTASAPIEPMSFRICFDDSTLYCAFTCVEPSPHLLRLRQRIDSEDVWQDDSVELFLRAAGERLDYDQFIVNAAGARWSLRHRGGASVSTPRNWTAAAQIAEGQWTVEIAVPFPAIGVDRVRQGQLVELKLGREDHTGPETVLSAWPPGGSYGGGQGYGRLYLGDPNLLANADFALRDGSVPEDWSITEGDEALYQPVEEDGRRLVRITTPGRYSALSQSLVLEPTTSYLLSAEVRGEAIVYLRGRTVPQLGEPSVPHTAWFEPDPQWRALAVPFATGPDGRAEIIIGSTESSGKGVVELRRLTLVQTGRLEVAGPPISVPADGKRVVVTEVPVADSRVVRGFVGTPFDGTQRSRSWSGRIWEYPMPEGGAGVGYAYRNNDGLHVRLADSLGFDAIQVRGGIRADLYAGEVDYRGPGEAGKIYAFAGRALISRVNFAERVNADRVSFFDVGDGVMANVSFFRVGRQMPEGTSPLVTWRVGGEVDASEAVRTRFQDEELRTFALQAGGFPRGDDTGRGFLQLGAGEVVHLLSPVLGADTALAAVELMFSLVDADRAEFTVTLQDPIDFRLVLTEVDMEVSGQGRVRLVLDCPDQVVPAGGRLWLTLEADHALQLTGADGNAPEVILHGTTRERALRQALPYRKFRHPSQRGQSS